MYDRNHYHDHVKLGPFFLLMVVLLFMLISPTSSQSLNQIQEWKSGLAICNFDGKAWTTGFFVDRDIVVTTRHLISTLSVFAENFPIYVTTHKMEKAYKAKIVYSNISSDVLFLRVEKYKSSVWFSETEKPKWGQRCIVLGFPKSWLYVEEGRIILYWTNEAIGVNVRSFPGGSGSVVLSLNGKVLGMVRGFSKHTGNAMLVPIISIQNGLKALKESK